MRLTHVFCSWAVGAVLFCSASIHSAHVVASTNKEISTQETVKIVQYGLKELGFYDSSVDGICGAGTESAIVAYRESKSAAVGENPCEDDINFLALELSSLFGESLSIELGLEYVDTDDLLGVSNKCGDLELGWMSDNEINRSLGDPKLLKGEFLLSNASWVAENFPDDSYAAEDIEAALLCVAEYLLQ